MHANLLIVHPHHCFDTKELTRNALIALGQRFADERTFVLVNDEHDDAPHYLLRMKLPEHTRSSHGGEMSSSFVARILADCDTVTIAGHTGNYCHHTAFEMILEGFERSLSSLSIILPTFAISDDRGDTGRPLSREVLSRQKHQRDIGFPIRIEQHRERFEGMLSRKELAVLNVFAQYLTPAIFRAYARHTLVIAIDGRTVGKFEGSEKSLTLSIENTPG